jgi:hypothetical protein
MKTLKTIFLVVLAATMFAACTADFDKIIVKQDGTWNVAKSTTESYTNGVLDSTEVTENDGTITFKDDMTGSYVDSDGTTGNFTWAFNEELETITITEDSFPLTFDILESSNNAQTLQTEIAFEFFGVEIKTVNTIELER